MSIKVAIVNRSKKLSDADIIPVVAALQIQTVRDLGPIWGIDAHVGFVPAGEEAAADRWQQVVVDKPTDADSLGYHETTKSGLPIGFTSIDAAIKSGENWMTTLSHEMVELLVDPFVFSVVAMGRGRYTWLECADACEAFSYSITLESGHVIQVSDFQTPAWFGAPRKPNSPYTFLDTIDRPFKLAKGGYMGVIEADGSYQQITKRLDPNRALAREQPLERGRRWRRLRALESGSQP